MFSWILSRKVFRVITPDSWFLFFRFKDHLGYYPNLVHPKTFNEKLQWLKLNNRNPEYSLMVDKYEVRNFISNKLGVEYLIPLVGGPWLSFDDINFDSLPDSFVLKCTHDSASVFICKEKKKFDKIAAKKKIEKALKLNYYTMGREWPYKTVKPRIIAERLMKDDSSDDLKDYKFFCFNGKVHYFKIDFDRFINHKANYFDLRGNIQPFGEVSCPNDLSRKHEMPDNLSKMVELAERLSVGIPFVRVDFYSINRRIFFGELTFFPAGGFGRFYPEEWDLKLGNLITLSPQSYE